MGYTIKDFIDLNKFPELQLISDNSGIKREIKGVRIIAVPDMERVFGKCKYLEWVFIYKVEDGADDQGTSTEKCSG